MANYGIKVDLLKVKGAFVTNIKGRTTTKQCLCIPIDGDSGLFLGAKGCYLDMAAIEMRNPQFGDTHCVKVSYDKSVLELMTDEQKQSIPILGGLHPIERKAPEPMPVQGFADVDDDYIPF